MIFSQDCVCKWANILLQWKIPFLKQQKSIWNFLAFPLGAIISTLTVSSPNIEIIKQIKDKKYVWIIHQNKRLSSVFLIVGKRTKKVASVFVICSGKENARKLQTQALPLDLTLSPLWFPLHQPPMIAALWLILFVSFILSQSREDQHRSARCPRGLISPKTHSCFWDYPSALRHLATHTK